MRSIVRRDTGGLSRVSDPARQGIGIATPTREDLARLDRKRMKKTSNKDWTNPHDPDAKVAKMKDGRTHLAHKANHAVDLETGAIVAVTLQGADEGDTATIIETVIAAAEQVEGARRTSRTPSPLEEAIAARGSQQSDDGRPRRRRHQVLCRGARFGGVATGRRRPRPRPRYMAIAAASADDEDGA